MYGASEGPRQKEATAPILNGRKFVGYEKLALSDLHGLSARRSREPGSLVRSLLCF